MLLVSAKDFFGFLLPGMARLDIAGGTICEFYLLVGLVNIINRDDGQVTVISRITQGKSTTSFDVQLVDLFFRDIKIYRYAEKVAICKTGFCDHPDELLALRP